MSHPAETDICPECGTEVDRASGYPYWVDRETKQRHHDPCPTDEDRASWARAFPRAETGGTR